MKDFLEELLVVLVVYKMKIAESPAYHSLTTALSASNCAASLFIYDNSPIAQETPDNTTWSTEYFHDSANSGVSKAYNEGFTLARQRKKKWLLLADQDTTFPLIAFDEYLRSILRFQPKIVSPMVVDQFGIVSPFKFKFGGGKRLHRVSRNVILPLGEFFFINSGLLISADAFEQVKGYDPQFRLDFSDLDLAFRLRQLIKSFAIADFECSHHLTSTLSHDANESLARFGGYVVACRAFGRKHKLGIELYLHTFSRAIKLSWRFKSFKFMIVFFKE